MTGWLVDQGEVVAVVLDLRSVDGREPELTEDAAHLDRGDGHRVEAAASQWWRRTGEVEALGFQAAGPSGDVDGTLAFVGGSP